MFYKNYYAHVEKRIAAMKKDNCLKIRKVFNFCFQFPHKSLYRKGKKFENCENFRSLFILIITRNLFKVIFVNKIQKKIAVELPNTFFKKIMFTLLNTLTICTCFSNFHFGIQILKGFHFCNFVHLCIGICKDILVISGNLK